MTSIDEPFDVSARIIAAVLIAADTRQAVKRTLVLRDGLLFIGELGFPLAGKLAFAAGGPITTGPTYTNVNDVSFVLIAE